MKTGQVKLVSPIAVPIPLSIQTATLVRITGGQRIICDRTYGNYTIPPCPQGQRYIAIKIKSARASWGTKTAHGEWEVKAVEVAEDLARECNTNLWGIGADVTGEIITGSDDDPEVETVRGFNGVFVSDFDVPSEEELEIAEGLLAVSDEILTTRGHQTYDAAPNRPQDIHEGFKRAARRLGVEAAWLYKVSNNPNCPHCGARLLMPSATVCATCGRDVKPAAAVHVAENTNSKGKNKSDRHEAA